MYWISDLLVNVVGKFLVFLMTVTDLPGINTNHKLLKSIVLHFISVVINPVKEVPTFLFLSVSNSLLLLTAYLS